MVPPATTPRRTAAVAAVLVLLLAGCGAELGEGAGASGGGSGGGKTTTTRPIKKVTLEDLKAIRPQAKDVPDEYRTTPRTGDSSDQDEALDDACPDLAPFFVGEPDPATDVEVQFQTRDARGLAVKLSLAPEIADEDSAAAFVTAVEGCDGYEFEDEDGVEISLEFTSAEPLSGYGDLGVQAVYQQNLSFDGDTIEREVTVLRFVRNGVGISVGAVSGVRESDYGPVAADLDEAQDLAKDLDAKVTELTQ